jgi:hypothetical protein
MNPTLRRVLLAVCAAAVPLPAITADSPRFESSAEVRPLARSADGRFSASGEARVLPAESSADGRFVLKATNTPTGGCVALPDPIFANGFEP